MSSNIILSSSAGLAGLIFFCFPDVELSSSEEQVSLSDTSIGRPNNVLWRSSTSLPQLKDIQARYRYPFKATIEVIQVVRLPATNFNIAIIGQDYFQAWKICQKMDSSETLQHATLL